MPMAHEMGVVSPSLGRSSTISGAEGAAEDCCAEGAAEVGADCKRSAGSPDEQAPEEASPLLEAPVRMEVPFMAAISSKSVMASRDALRMRRAWRQFSCYETKSANTAITQWTSNTCYQVGMRAVMNHRPSAAQLEAT